MTWTGNVKHIQVVLLDNPVQMHVDEVLPRRCTPMGDHQWLDVFELERFLQERVFIEVDLAGRNVIGCPPIGVHPAKQVWSERRATLQRLLFGYYIGRFVEQFLGGEYVRRHFSISFSNWRHGQVTSLVCNPSEVSFARVDS